MPGRPAVGATAERTRPRTPPGSGRGRTHHCGADPTAGTTESNRQPGLTALPDLDGFHLHGVVRADNGVLVDGDVGQEVHGLLRHVPAGRKDRSAIDVPGDL